MILESEQSLAHEWVITAPLRQGFVVGPEARSVLLSVIGRALGQAFFHVKKPVLLNAVVLEELGQGAEDAPSLE